ncbi:unnamed protein product [Tetraodon nigroviridis]|uniref:(spotted green pufferfish) hypothetical protein n=1 Tax=Tetraodon nigroviridis TaxID=99883 RepID=Q4RXW6_TETNG|nr:unnamed protein product [Tetraodon nigroviridis]
MKTLAKVQEKTQEVPLKKVDKQTLTLWPAARLASPRRRARRPASARGAPVPARRLRPGGRGTPSAPSRNGWPTPSASRTPTPPERWRRRSQRGVQPRRRFLATLRPGRGRWNRLAATPPSHQEKRVGDPASTRSRGRRPAAPWRTPPARARRRWRRSEAWPWRRACRRLRLQS